MTILIICPAFNEAANIGKVIERYKNLPDVSMLVVDDGSTDNTSLECKQYGVNIISHNENCGYEKALETGIDYFLKSEFDHFVIADADNEIFVDNIISELRNYSSVDQYVLIGQRKNKNRLIEHVLSIFTSYKYNINDIFCGSKSISKNILNGHDISDITKNIFTYFVIKKINNHKIIKNIRVDGERRYGNSKFGSGFRSELLLLKSFLKNYV